MLLEGEITKKHIKEGIRRRRTKCPVALAIQEAAGANWDIIVKERRIVAQDKATKLLWEARMGFELSQFVLMADFDKDLKPSKFSLDFYMIEAE